MNNTTYSAGTVTVGVGSTTVTGSGTAWLTSGVRAGDVLNLAGLLVVIASVNSPTSLTLKRPWMGAAQSGADYDILLLDDEVRSLVAANQLLQTLGTGTLTSLGQITGTANQMPYWTGAGVMSATALTAAARSLLDDADAAAMRTTIGVPRQESATDISSVDLLTRVDGVNAARLSEFGTYASSGANIDDLVAGDVGLYSASNAGTWPADHGGGSTFYWITTQRLYTTGVVYQKAIPYGYNSTIAAIGSTYFRFKDNAGVWGKWRRVFDQNTIIGAVSMDGAGRPDGSVIEQGSNANGYYTKFADGTAICRVLATIKPSSDTTNGVKTITWDFPITFASGELNVCTGSLISQNPNGRIGPTFWTPTTTSVAVYYNELNAQASTQFIRMMAVGRWA